MKALTDNIIVSIQDQQQESTTASGIIVAGNSAKNYAIVASAVSVGPLVGELFASVGGGTEASPISAGDLLAIRPGAGFSFTVDGMAYLTVNQRDVLAVL